MIDKNVSTKDETKEIRLSEMERNSNKLHMKLKVRRKKKKKKIRSKDKCSQKKERKATQTLAIVLGEIIRFWLFKSKSGKHIQLSVSFLVCWVPFFTCNILDALSIKYNLNTSPGNFAFQATTLLGYINSCVNPIIYTIFNPEFRKAFRRVLGLGH